MISRSYLVLLLIAGVAPAAAPPVRLTERQALLGRQRDALWKQMQQWQQQGKLDEAERACRKVLALEHQLFGTWHKDVADTLEVLAQLRETKEDWKEAVALLRQRADLLTRLHGAHAFQSIDAHQVAADGRLRAGWTIDQRRLWNRAVELNRRAIQLSRQGQAARGIPLVRQALQLHKDLLGEKHPRYALYLNNLATLYKEVGDLRQALPLLQKAKELHETQARRRHPDYAITLHNLASVYKDMGEPRDALPLFQQALAVHRLVQGEDQLHHAASLINLAGLYQMIGEHRQALRLFLEARELIEQIEGKKRLYAIALNNLALLHQEMGEHRLALSLLLEAAELRRQLLGESHRDYAISLNNLAGLYQEMGEYRQALPLLRKALEIHRTARGETHPYYAQTLNNLASLYRELREYRLALPLYREALERLRDTRGKRHPDHATTLTNLAVLYQRMGNLRQALPLLVEAQQQRKAVLGTQHPAYANSLHNLASLHQALGEFSQALAYLEEAVTLTARVLGKHHPTYATSLHNLALLHQARGDPGRATPLHGLSLRLGREYRAAVAHVQGERQQLASARMLRHRLDHFLSIAPAAQVPASVIHTEVLASKGSVLNDRLLRRLLAESADETTRRRIVQLQHTSQDIAVLARAPFEPHLAETRRQRLEELTRRKDDLEVALSRQSELFRRQQQQMTSRQLARLLPEGVALVDFFVYVPYLPQGRDIDSSAQERLIAFILHRDAETVLVDLGPTAPLRRNVERWRLGVHGKGMDQAGLVLRRSLWLPIERHLRGARTVLLSPDGVLHALAFAALPGRTTGSYLLEEYTLAVLPSPRHLGALPSKPRHEDDASLLLVGNIDFDPGPRTSAAPASRSAPGDRRPTWDALPGTAREVQHIADLFRKRFPKGKVHLLQQREPSRTLVRRVLGEYRWLHLATHGFFASATHRSALAGGREPPEAFADPGVTGWHPLLLSGIVLAGANGKVKPEEEDGILTALEVSEMDLRAVDLVVLSACETGLGAIAHGEGVYGLQRAFQTAGARSSLTSLWSVSDAATSVLMEEFYKRLWDRKPISKRQALRQAQLFVLNHPNRVAERVKELRLHLAKRGVTEDELQRRGLGKHAVRLPTGTARSPVAWWGAFVLADEGE